MPGDRNTAGGGISFSIAPGFINQAVWKGLLFLNLYRIAIASFLLVLGVNDIMQARSPEVGQIFSLAGWAYLALSVLQAAGGMWLRNMPYLLQVSLGMLLDVVVFAIFNFTVAIGDHFNILLLVSLSGAAVLARGHIAWVYASMSALALLFQALQLFLLGVRDERHFIPVIIYCVICYVVVAGARWLSEHIRRTENMVSSVAAHLGRINEHIIDILRAGIVVLDDGNRVLFANRPAIHLLECKRQPEGRAIGELSPELAELAASGGDHHDSTQFNGIDAQLIKLPKRYGIGAQKLITMEQSSIVRQQAEAMKNASLARMAASVMHEVRNPLGAISHAAQLLQEDASLSEDSKEMASVIVRQANRMNLMVTNITQMGRTSSSSQTIELLPWVHDLAEELRQLWALPQDDFVITGDRGVTAEADGSQLHQALANLCGNARRHSVRSPRVSLSVGMDGDMYSYIDVADTGAGIHGEQLQRLFEPFSSASGGLGLGLYISRELVKANGGSLLLLHSDQGGSVFRLRLQRGSGE